LNFYETLHSFSTQAADVHKGIPQNLKGEIIQLILSNCVKFHKNSISSLVGVALTRYMPPFFVKV
jgi:hypothetical protein